ncbi:MAG: universal stress protein [Brevibacterium yomogidense]|uniref:universal stress protein n=1 Tax=Brevibacterium sp. Mu109 TaxID=1255669 RepID=UPI000C360110|nr:universal stress protein [Brevibacterium sp. Mu109]SMX83148.1 Nucleotide-binding universal stress protein, UspA family [Brevibacterium sp. Mu109]
MNDIRESTVKDQVLVGVDGSANSARAFEVALAIAKRQGWSLRLVGCYSVTFADHESGLTVSENFRRAMESNSRHPLEAFAEQAKADGVKASFATFDEHAADALVRESASARLAVVGKRGRNRFAGRFLGSVSGALAAHGHCSALVIPEKWETPDPSKIFAPGQDQPGGEHAATEPTELLSESAPPRPRGKGFHNVADQMNFRQEIVVGVDLGEPSRRIALAAARFAEMFGRSLTLVSATPLNADAWYPNPVEHNIDIPSIRSHYTDHLATLVTIVKDRHPELDVHWRFYDGTPAGVLSEATRTASVVAVGTRGHGGFTGLLMGSVSQSVLNRSASPVLVVPTLKNTV